MYHRLSFLIKVRFNTERRHWSCSFTKQRTYSSLDYLQRLVWTSMETLASCVVKLRIIMLKKFNSVYKSDNCNIFPEFSTIQDQLQVTLVLLVHLVVTFIVSICNYIEYRNIKKCRGWINPVLTLPSKEMFGIQKNKTCVHSLPTILTLV